jgi:hypothetical protein
VSPDDEREAQRVILLALLHRTVVDDWSRDLPTLAGRLMGSGLITVDVVKGIHGLVSDADVPEVRP